MSMHSFHHWSNRHNNSGHTKIGHTIIHNSHQKIKRNGFFRFVYSMFVVDRGVFILLFNLFVYLVSPNLVDAYTHNKFVSNIHDSLQNDIQKPNPQRSYLVSENFDLNSDNSININDDNNNNNNNNNHINKYSNYNQPESDLNINKIDDNNDKIIKNPLTNNDHLSANQIQTQSKIDDDYLSKSGSRKSPISRRNVDENKNQQHEKDNVRETPPTTTTSTFYTKYKQIVLYAFERSFKLNLMLIRNNQFLSPDLKIFKNSSSSSSASWKYRDDTSSINSNYDNTNETVDCFYRGVVDDDVKSFVYINLCHKGHVIGTFNVNNTDYFVEPMEEFDSSAYEKNEFSFVDFDFINNANTINERYKMQKQQHHHHHQQQQQQQQQYKVQQQPHIYANLSTHFMYTQTSFSSSSNKNTHLNDVSSVASKYSSSSSSLSASSSCALDDYNNDDKRVRTGKRSKRNALNRASMVIDRRIYLELLVVVDRKMFEYYDTNLENHILTLLFMVTQMYQHSSLINPIRVYVTDIVYLHKLDSRKYPNTFENEWEAEKILNKFCDWQHDYKKDSDLRNQVDATILITKTDICKKKDVCQTLGMARLNQICVSGQSCAVIEDSGINTAYTIAHEIGHLLGMKHVDEQRCKGLDNMTTQMMASMLDLTKKSHVWSNCSVEELNSFLRTGDAECLFNVPQKNPNFANRNMSFEDTNEQFDERTITNALFPGSLQGYEIRSQCQQIFGPKSDACEQNLDDDCKILWCTTYDFISLESPVSTVHCVTSNTKWADGTPCGLSESPANPPKICLNGECVIKSDSKTTRIDGQWSNWSEFTPCSRSCGGGIRKRYRACDNPKPQNGGKFCVGERYHYESCNTHHCKMDEAAFRDEQCRQAVLEINPQKIRDQMGVNTNNTFLWKAYYSTDPRRRCILFCRLEDRPNFAMLRPMVIDGTKCGLNSFDICVNGHCLPGGCDNALFSPLNEDNCGICGGENKSCKESSYTIETPNNFGYNKLSTIPVRSTNIFIHRQRDSDDLGCLALRSASSFLLNGHYVISKTSTSIKFDGKIIDYIVNETDEIIKSRGNFSQPLEIQFLAGSRKISNNIKFTYYTPITEPTNIRAYHEYLDRSVVNSNNNNYETRESRTNLLRHSDSGNSNNNNKDDYWSRNSKMPELFEKNITRVGQCDKMCNGMQVVYLNRCKKSGDFECRTTQLETRSCNTECDLRVLTSQGRCTPYVGECGQGKLDIKIECIKIDKINNSTRSVDLYYCDSNEVRSVNELYKNGKCYLPCDTFDWKLADTKCSCENGYKKWKFLCYNKVTNELVSDAKCQNKPMPKMEMVKCDVYCYKWQSSYWTECTKSCGTGMRYRKNFCIFNQTQIVDDSNCKFEQMPGEYEFCNVEECPKWSHTQWSECPAACDQKSRRTRRVYCVYKDTEVEASKCYGVANRPAEVDECKQECTGVWKTTEWGECSATCEKGIRTRSVYCQPDRNRPITASFVDDFFKQTRTAGSIPLRMQMFNDSMCDPKLRPPNVTECSVDEPCPKWIISNWSPCKGGCGVGFRTRLVYCSSSKPSACAGMSQPANYENCTVSCAGHWKAENWSECNGDCNIGWKFRNIKCVDANDRVLDGKECSNKEKPERRQRCFACGGAWKAGAWSKCSNSCGKGTQSRTVECYSASTNELLSESKCNPNGKLPETQECEDFSCINDSKPFEWKIISKGECSVTCGMGWRLRKIECRTSTNLISNACKDDNRPDYYELCDAGECPKWKTGAWSTCSSDCGEGIMRRMVVCSSSTGTVYDHGRCAATHKPDEVMKCTGASCGRWFSTPWSDCDFKICTKVRSVFCVHENGTRLPEINCNNSMKPSYISECDNRHHCKAYITNLAFHKTDDKPMTPNVGLLQYTNWSRCSTKCGPGHRTRKVTCKSVKNDSIELPMNLCSANKEPLTINCNLAQCVFKVVENWSQCSTSCGQPGVEVLERKCFEMVTKTWTSLDKCGLKNVASINRTCYKPCQRHIRPAFDWKVTTWKECSAKCGFGYKNRTVHCWNQMENAKTNDSNCNMKTKPFSSLPCMNVSCGYGWFVSEWTPCSAKCSKGYKTREVVCAKISKEGHILNITSDKCNHNEKPASKISCNYGECNHEYFWKPGHWSKCLPSCGFGYQRRSLTCVNKHGTHEKNISKCNNESMPITHQFCFTNCYVQSCSRLKSLFGVTDDGEYNLKISNRTISIYCKDMNSNRPKEYITLKAGENFAEIYDKQLIEPSKCKIGPRNGANCSFCKNETLPNHGITLFSKIRINLKTLKIIDDDYSFANVAYGNPVPFGHSGDCYSSLPECQHARLNINLKGTNFVFDSRVRWINYGEKPHSRIYYSKDNSSVYGTCGGLCGFCKPDPELGLQLKVVV